MTLRYTFLPVFLFFISFSAAVRAQSTVTVGNTTLDVRDVITGIDIPWEITWGPDDHIWFTERAGRVSRLNPETGVRTIVLNLTSTVYQQSESGMLGLALHPDFENTPYVVIAYTYSAGFNNIRERFVRYEYNGTALVNPLVLVENIPGNTTHIGCRILVLPDNTLLFTTGDAQQASTLPQNLNSLSGKVLRMNFDGTIPADNPFGTDSYVYTYGHRNPQGLVLAPNGKLYSSEHGPDTNDEFNLIEPGKNYGWNTITGFCNTTNELANCQSWDDYMDPLKVWYPSSTIAPSDLIFYDHPAIPEWQGRFVMTVLKNKHVRAIRVDDVNGTEVLEDVEYLTDEFGRLRDICMAPDGRVFLATNGPAWSNTQPNTHKIIELKNSAYDPVGIGSVADAVVTVHPNPASDELNIQLPAEMRQGLMLLIDGLGRTVASQRITTDREQLNTRALSNGVYHLSVIADGRVYSQRIIIAK